MTDAIFFRILNIKLAQVIILTYMRRPLTREVWLFSDGSHWRLLRNVFYIFFPILPLATSCFDDLLIAINLHIQEKIVHDASFLHTHNLFTRINLPENNFFVDFSLALMRFLSVYNIFPSGELIAVTILVGKGLIVSPFFTCNLTSGCIMEVTSWVIKQSNKDFVFHKMTFRLDGFTSSVLKPPQIGAWDYLPFQAVK